MYGEKDLRKGVMFLFIRMIRRTFEEVFFVGVHTDTDHKKGLYGISTEFLGTTDSEYGVSE